MARAFEPSTRVKHLSFTHHRLVASQPPDERAKWLARAAREHWSGQELLTAMSPGRRIESPSADASDADNTDATASSADVMQRASIDDAKRNTGSAATVHQDDRPAPEMSDDAKWRFNLNQGGSYLLHIPHVPITTYLHPEVHYTAEQWDVIAAFPKNLAAAMRNTVGTLDAAMEEEKTLAGGRG